MLEYRFLLPDWASVNAGEGGEKCECHILGECSCGLRAKQAAREAAAASGVDKVVVRTKPKPKVDTDIVDSGDSSYEYGIIYKHFKIPCEKRLWEKYAANPTFENFEEVRKEIEKHLRSDYHKRRDS